MSTTPTPLNSLTLSAILIGKGRTASPDIIQVTLKVQQDFLTLNLHPDDCVIFPDLSDTVGGGHPLYDPTQVVYNYNIPQYHIVISPLDPAPLAVGTAVPVPVAEPSPASEPESAVAAASTSEGV